MEPIPFNSFNNRYEGRTAWIIGRGPTRFDYNELATVTDPVFFLNDAVSLEEHVQGESFFFAHDPTQRVWLGNGIKSIAVIPLGGKIISDGKDSALGESLRVCFYRWQTVEGERLLTMNRDAVSKLEQLYRNTGTMHSLLHFIWYCGFARINFIGCDGINDAFHLTQAGDEKTGYDKRLQNKSNSSPWWQYDKIREVQDRLCKRFGFKTTFLGTPNLPSQKSHRVAEQLIPKVAHFVWMGSAIPDFIQGNIDRFATLNPEWEIKIWNGIPEEFPQDLWDLALKLPFMCMRSDLIRLWILHSHGGIYLDCDVYSLRSFNDLLNYDHFFGLEKNGFAVSNAVIGAQRGSIFLDMLFKAAVEALKNTANFEIRTLIGPDLLDRFRRQDPDVINLLPQHYFSLFNNHGSAVRFTQLGIEEQRKSLLDLRCRIKDGVTPFAIHTCGIPGNQVGLEEVSSSFALPDKAADNILRKVGNKPSTCLILGSATKRTISGLQFQHPALDILLYTLNEEWRALATQLDKSHTGANRNTLWIRSTLVVVDNSETIQDKSVDWLVYLDESAGNPILAEKWEAKLKSSGEIIILNPETDQTESLNQSFAASN